MSKVKDSQIREAIIRANETQHFQEWIENGDVSLEKVHEIAKVVLRDLHDPEQRKIVIKNLSTACESVDLLYRKYSVKMMKDPSFIDLSRLKSELDPIVKSVRATINSLILRDWLTSEAGRSASSHFSDMDWLGRPENLRELLTTAKEELSRANKAEKAKIYANLQTAISMIPSTYRNKDKEPPAEFAELQNLLPEAMQPPKSPKAPKTPPKPPSPPPSPIELKPLRDRRKDLPPKKS